MFGRLIIAFSIIQLYCLCTNAQVSLSGYINNYSLIGETEPNPFDEALWQNITCQRLIFNWSINKNFDIQISNQTNLSFGNSTLLRLVKETSTDNHNLLKLSCLLIDKEDKWLNLALDRLLMRWSTDKLEVSLGRQRINWGNTVLWHPNDIFDSSPFLNFTYPERMGCDAVRAAYYHNEVATSELAVSADKRGSPTIAILHRNLYRNLDFQLLGGVYKRYHWVAGGGFTTELNEFSIRFEGSYFHDSRKESDKVDVVQASIGIDKIFQNNFILQAEALYTNKPDDITDLISSYMYTEYSLRRLTTSRWSFAGQIYYPFSGLFSINALMAYLPDQSAVYVGVGMNYLISQNLEASAMVHAFDLNINESYPMDGRMGTLQVKYFF